MANLNSKFTKQDIETLLEAVDDWEITGNHEYHILNMIKNAPMPPENHEAFESMLQIKNYFQNKEKDILASRSVRQEKSIFLKAKLMMARNDLGINELFEMSKEDIKSNDLKQIENSSKQDDAKKQLSYAEYFIKDLGVWDHFQKFLADKKNSIR